MNIAQWIFHSAIQVEWKVLWFLAEQRDNRFALRTLSAVHWGKWISDSHKNAWGILIKDTAGYGPRSHNGRAWYYKCKLIWTEESMVLTECLIIVMEDPLQKD